MTDEDRRHSVASEAYLIKDDIERAEAEARNGLRQFDLASQMIMDAIEKGDSWKLRLSTIVALHREALEGISSYAGNFRPASVTISGSDHEPVEAHRVPSLIEELCDYVNDNWLTATPIHLASYVMWRLNWIHPFSDGNGRTSRMVSYLVLSVKLKMHMPGGKTIPEQIVENRVPYFNALEAADRAAQQGQLDLTEMDALLERLLAMQLAVAMEAATGKHYLDDESN